MIDYIYTYVAGLMVTAALVGLTTTRKELNEDAGYVLWVCILWPIILPIWLPLTIGTIVRAFWRSQ